MYKNFTHAEVPLDQIDLDYKNPRIVTKPPLTKQSELIEYLFRHEGLSDFIRRIADVGKHFGAELPYIIKSGERYTVIEGNTRIAAYKILCGFATPPTFAGNFPTSISDEARNNLLSVACTIAPTRESLLSIVAEAHFGTGDKSKWGYLGSRQAIYNEWVHEKSIERIAAVFKKKPSEIRNFLMEYKLHSEAISLEWTPQEREKLLDPRVKFNPPVRFLEGQQHKQKTGITYDKDKIEINFRNDETLKKFQHLVRKLVLELNNGLSATSSYEAVFADFQSVAETNGGNGNTDSPTTDEPLGSDNNDETSSSTSTTNDASPPPSPTKKHNRIPKENELLIALRATENKKLISLYSSITTISLKQHTPLLVVATWVLLETLTSSAGRKEGESFSSYLSVQKLESLDVGVEKEDRKAIAQAIKRISEYGNTTKHHKQSGLFGNDQLLNDFETINSALIALARSSRKKE